MRNSIEGVALSCVRWARESLMDNLSDREQQVLKLIAEGNTTKQIAAFIGLHVRTVQIHRKHFMLKLQLKNTVEVVRFAVRQRLIDP